MLAHLRGQIKEGLDGAYHADWVFKLEHSKLKDQDCLPIQDARSRKAWKEPTTLIGTSKWNIESAGSRLPARSGRQNEEGLEGANHADWILESGPSKRRVKVACLLRKPDRGRLKRSEPF